MGVFSSWKGGIDRIHFYKGGNICDLLYTFPHTKSSSEKGSALKGKNFFLFLLDRLRKGKK